ncbi:hypothetical protein TKK_0008234 [Trichogramma kaykai]
MASFKSTEDNREQKLTDLMKKFNLEDDDKLFAFLREFEVLISNSLEDTMIRKHFFLSQYLRGNCKDHDGYSYLHVACRHGWDDIVRAMLRHDEDPNCRVPETGDTPLILALKHEHVAVVEVLLKHRTDPSLPNKKGSTPLHVVCQKKEFNEDLAKKFFKAIDDERQTIEVNAKEKLGNMPLQLAFSHSHKKAVALLLRKGADPNSENEEGSNLLHLICQGHGDLDIMDTLFKITDDICSVVRTNAWDNMQNTPLHWAVRLEHSKDNRMMVRNMLHHNANPNLMDANGETVLHVVSKRDDDKIELLETLFKWTDLKHLPLLVDAKNKEDRTPLELAAAGLLPNKVRVLLENGADASRFTFRCEDFFKGEDVVDFNLDSMSRILASSNILKTTDSRWARPIWNR